jgi:hypothetical protein
MRKTNPQSSGMALLVTLAFVVMISIIVVGFAVSMRTDRPAAKSHLEKSRAYFLAQRGADEVLATLRKTTEDPERNWISQPGQLIAGASTNDPLTPIDDRKVLTNVVPLSSGLSTATPTDPVYQAPNLNVPTLRDPGKCLITDRLDPAAPTSKIKMPVKWIYVRKDGTTDTNELPPLLITSNSINPIVGRYAYWADDESSKVNYNLAWGRGAANINPPAHPSKIDLTALTNLTQSMADAIHSFITLDINYGTLPLRFFNTPEESRQIELQASGPGVAAALAANKFELTHYNHDPNTTFFNEPRIVLTTRPDRAGWTKATSGPYNGQWVGTNGKPGKEGKPYYIRIIVDGKEGEDGATKGPSPFVNLDAPMNTPNRINPGKLSDTINNLTSYMQRTDWSMVAGSSSLQDKYFSAYPTESIRATRLAQLAINIIDYVRCKEGAPWSTTGQDFQGMVQPLRVISDGLTPPAYAKSEAPSPGVYARAYFGQTRTPLINEVGVWLSPDFKTMTFKVELCLPENYGLNQVDVSKLYLITESGVPGFSIETPSNPISASIISNPILTKGNYSVITYTRTTGSATNRPTTATARVAIALSAPDKRLDVVPASSTFKISCPVDPVGVAPNDITSLEVDDPRVNKHPNDWKPRASGNTFGAPNSISALKGPKAPDLGMSPQQDTDASGNLSTASLYMPPPAGTIMTRLNGSVDDNTRGMVTSAGELGYIHTGVECSPKTPASPPPQLDLPAGTPWRTMRLQPNSQATTVVPDWAFMDLFTSPLSVSTNAKYVYNPRDTAIGGRVNVNAKVEPFGSGLDRTLPLAAVLQGCGNDSANSVFKVTAAQALTLAGNIYRRVLATGGKSYGYPSAYDSAGEIVEIKGIADGGEQSEELYRQISNLVTARGNVFSIFAIGQAIVQTPDGRLLVTAEQRTRTIVERFLNPVSNKIEFGSVYFRSLNQ